MTRRAYHGPARLPIAVQIAQMRTRHPELRLVSWRKGQVRWSGILRPSDASASYRVTIAYRLGMRPRVYVTAPDLTRRGDDNVPHLHADGSLCLHLPDEWVSTLVIAETIVPWAVLWLYYYEMWHATGEWLGGGAHPQVSARRARRIAEEARRRSLSETAGAA